MTMPKVVALEEHFCIDELWGRQLGGIHERVYARLADYAELRLREMDEAKIDMQVISHAPPAAQNLPAADAIRLARRANEVLHDIVGRCPDRYAGFAILPTPDPAAAADELARAVEQYGFKGAMIHGLTHGSFMDDKRFWPIFARAQALDVPVYIHPGTPHPAATEAYYKPYSSMMTAGWAYTAETATHAIRLVLSGLFDAYPSLKIVLGHLGEGLPFSLWRCDQSLSRGNTMPRRFKDYFRDHFYLTTSGNFSYPALLCSMLELGVDRIMFSVDWPFVPNEPGTRWLQDLQISPD